MWEESGFIFWQLSGKREKGKKKKLLDHSLLLTMSVGDGEREKNPTGWV